MSFDYKIRNLNFFKTKILLNSFFKDNRGTIYSIINSKIEKKIGLSKFKNSHNKIMIRKKNSLTGIHGDKKTWKLISCLEGSIKLVLVNCNLNSQYFGKHLTIDLKKNDQKSVIIPPNIGNSYLCKKKNNIIFYKIYHNGKYNDHDEQFTYFWNDKRFKINWGIKKPILSKRDNPQNYD